ncbi:hypothetical protein QBC38DRAFT_29998 [Podospora fimiseda]|uniref:Uncharacterized protein n=1 Tax=Podospora fimiseda TaxID=252190 RepID=A0AAN7H6T2_9PEZI|nr:hypothetical protein QBC38DRAFT_29998 [Podospora fimiseda]
MCLEFSKPRDHLAPWFQHKQEIFGTVLCGFTECGKACSSPEICKAHFFGVRDDHSTAIVNERKELLAAEVEDTLKYMSCSQKRSIEHFMKALAGRGDPLSTHIPFHPTSAQKGTPRPLTHCSPSLASHLFSMHRARSSSNLKNQTDRKQVQQGEQETGDCLGSRSQDIPPSIHSSSTHPTVHDPRGTAINKLEHLTEVQSNLPEPSRIKACCPVPADIANQCHCIAVWCNCNTIAHRNIQCSATGTSSFKPGHTGYTIVGGKIGPVAYTLHTAKST